MRPSGRVSDSPTIGETTLPYPALSSGLSGPLRAPPQRLPQEPVSDGEDRARGPEAAQHGVDLHRGDARPPRDAALRDPVPAEVPLEPPELPRPSRQLALRHVDREG